MQMKRPFNFDLMSRVSRMACKENAVCMVDAHHLASVIRGRNEKVRKLNLRAPLTSSNGRDILWRRF
jgi:hypothetical protein